MRKNIKFNKIYIIFVNHIIYIVSILLCLTISAACNSNQVALPIDLGKDFLNALSKGEESAVRQLLMTHDECVEWARTYSDKKRQEQMVENCAPV